ncbi:glycosyltransferase [Paenibacillus sp. N4]|uniref:glycosyltransferase n=1 Tax=Paenibacillus vietnamensis TaxID=2590547 RepID=UPI001CD052BF|nr:glycosyltransferase [Paenibacillus vietnamensis]MCA0755383.1 glycosyltransferase [Paenibacillus vietnamensis]
MGGNSSNKPKVSVIIPVYNAEAYLSECLDSLLAQTLHECEFICVNDGSRDRSRAIIEVFLNKDARVRLIDQPNRGVSAARNAGLAAASGEYAGFVDADDRVEPDMFETLYAAAAAGGYDILFSNFVSETEAGPVVNRCPFPAGTRLDAAYIQKEILPLYIESDQFNSVCNKLYRRELICGHRVAFPDKVALGEDGLFNMLALSCSSSVSYIDYSGYFYREVAGSATRSAANKDYFARALEVYEAKLPPAVEALIERERAASLKTVKFIRSVISYIHLYYTPAAGLSFGQKYRYVKRMIGHSVLREALPAYLREAGEELGRYERMILRMMLLRSAIGLYWVTAYSRARNKQSIGG